MKKNEKNKTKLRNITNRREYSILNKYIAPYENDCGVCPMNPYRRSCRICDPKRTIERNWKSFRKTQWKSS